MKLLPALSLFFFFAVSQTAYGQYYDTGEDPAALKWMQIKTERFRVIYPEKYGLRGVEFTLALENAASDLENLFPVKKSRIPVIIHNYTTQSNGYVAWAPKRMEIFPTPEQNGIPLDANRQLALHELTHVYQMQSLNRGLTKVLSVPLGQQFPGVVAALLPQWYMEGEAVLAESILSESGRGRAPSFQKSLKAISIEKGKMYRYDKIVNGSYRNFVPDHYQSGFQMVAWSYAAYNPRTWNKALTLTGNAPILLNPVNLSLRSTTGLTKRKLFMETFDTLGKTWHEDILERGAKPYQVISPAKGKAFANYYSPVKIDDNNYIVVKTTLYNPPEFVNIDILSGREKRIHVPGYMYPYHITAGNMTLAWVEFQNDPRWDNRNYSIVKVLDMRTNMTKQLSWKSRYMSVAISPDGKSVAVTENTPENRNNLVILNASTGKVVRSIPSPDNAYLQRPQWSAGGTEITFITLTGSGEGIRSFRMSDQQWHVLIPETPVDFQSSFLRNDSLFFVSSSDGTENIHVMTPAGKTASLTNSRFGATDFLLSGSNIIFCDYTSSGNNISIANIKNEAGGELEYDPSFFLIDRIKPPGKNLLQDQVEGYTPERYRKWLHPFGFHSWMPFYADIEEIKSDPLAVRPGFTLMSQNHLSTLITSVGYEYSDNLHKLHSRITWKGWYPVLETGIDYGDRPLVYKPEARDEPSVIKPGLFFTNTLSLPLSFRTGKFSLYIRPSATAVYQNNYLFSTEKSAYDYGQTLLAGRFFFSNTHLMAERDIYPRLAQVVDIYYSWYPFDTEFYGSDLVVRTAFYFPGLMKNNSLRIRFENEFQSTESFLNFNLVNFPRGYRNIISEDLTSFSADYSAPLAYPDFNIASLLYLKRFRAGIFYDYAKGTNNYYLKTGEGGYVVDRVSKTTEKFQSYGASLLADFHVLRLPYMVSAGVQASWTEGEKIPVLEALFNINIYGMNIGKKPRL